MNKPINALYLSWRQLVSRRKNLLAALSGNIVAFTLIFMQLGFEQGIYTAGTSLHRILQTDAVIINPSSVNINRMKTLSTAALGDVLANPNVEHARKISTGIAYWRSQLDGSQRPILILGVPVGQEVLGPEIESELKASALEIPGNVVVDSEARPELGGRMIPANIERSRDFEFQINNKTVRPIGLHPLGFPVCTEGMIIASLETFSYLAPEQSNTTTAILLTLKDKSSTTMNKTIEKLNLDLPDNAVVISKDAWIRREIKFWAENTPVGLIFRFGVLIGIVVSSVFIYQILLSDIAAHLSEYATLKAIGYEDYYLRRVVLYQGILLSLGSCPFALAISLVLLKMWRDFTKIPLNLTPSNVLGVLALGLLISVLSSFFATESLAKADPVDNF